MQLRVLPLVARILTVLAFMLPIGLIAHAITFWRHGVIDSEAMEFVLNYLQKRPFLAQIFDPQLNDWGAYQARELSYIFDFIDARLFATLLDRHVLIFVPLSGVVGLLAFAGVYFCGARKVFKLDDVSACLLLSLFLSCIVVQASTPVLYRSSKIILCVALLAFLFHIFDLLNRRQQRITPLRITALSVLGLIMGLCDRQGFYYLVSTTIVVLLTWLMARIRRQTVERPVLAITAANTGAIIGTVLYNRLLAPRLIHSLNGYWPDFTYQNLPRSTLFDPSLPAKTWDLFQEQVSFFFGSLPLVVLIAIALTAAVVIGWRFRSAIRRINLTILVVSAVSIFALIGLFAVMIARHPQLYSIRDHAYWYYTLSVHAVFLFAVSAWISCLSPASRSRIIPAVNGLAVILIVLNIRAYAHQRQTITTGDGWFAGQFEHSQALISQFATTPPDRDKLLRQTNDLFLDDQAHFLENVERSYLHLTGAIPAPPSDQH